MAKEFNLRRASNCIGLNTKTLVTAWQKRKIFGEILYKNYYNIILLLSSSSCNLLDFTSVSILFQVPGTNSSVQEGQGVSSTPTSNFQTPTGCVRIPTQF